MALSQRTDWHRAYQNALGVTVYSEYDDGSVGTFGIRFADGTTQFTAASAGGGGVRTQTSPSTSGNITIAASTNVTVLATGGAGGITQTLPSAVGLQGQRACIKKVDSGVGTVTVGTTSAQTIDGTVYGTSYVLSNQGQFVDVESDNANWQIVGQN